VQDEGQTNIKKPAQILNDFCPVKGASVHFEIVYVTPCFFFDSFPNPSDMPF